jgi:hypothetical protein
MSKPVILYRAHVVNDVVKREVARLRAELPEIDLFIVGYSNASPAPPNTTAADMLVYRRPDLERLGYAEKYKSVDWGNPVGHNDLPVMRFFRDHPAYTHYWAIEYDVRYTGNWKSLFDELALSQADLLGTNILDYDQGEVWQWWGAAQLPESWVPLEQRMRSFLPFFRISRAGLRAIDHYYRQGWAGHYEMAFPTICKVAGLKIEDIGGDGRYSVPSRRNKHYRSNIKSFALFPGTFVFKPAFNDQDIQTYGMDIGEGPLLWHPIK